MNTLLRLEDNTVITYAEPDTAGAVHVKIVRGSASASYVLPSHTWEKVDGFTGAEVTRFTELIKSASHRIPYIFNE